MISSKMLAIIMVVFISALGMTAPATQSLNLDMGIAKLNGLHGKRSACALPGDSNLVYVPGAVNNGWAIPPDRSCEIGQYCPFACRSGLQSAQWNPNSASTMDADLYCGSDGTPIKPFPDLPYCVPGTPGFGAKDFTGLGISFCQTVYPGYEDMIIPTDISGSGVTPVTIAGPDYWHGTASAFYINPPGVHSSQGCVWGDSSSPIGNWAPYTAGGHTTADGITWLDIAWNPIYIGAFPGVAPTFGLSIEICNMDGTGCETLCQIQPGQALATVQGIGKGVNPDGSQFCTETIPAGMAANFVVFGG